MTKKIIKPVFWSKFINWLYSREGYNFLKSGMYFDHLSKKIVKPMFKQITVFLGIFFLEKFSIEFLTKKLNQNIGTRINNFFMTNKKFSLNNISILIIFFIIFLTLTYFI